MLRRWASNMSAISASEEQEMKELGDLLLRRPDGMIHGRTASWSTLLPIIFSFQSKCVARNNLVARHTLQYPGEVSDHNGRSVNPHATHSIASSSFQYSIEGTCVQHFDHELSRRRMLNFPQRFVSAHIDATRSPSSPEPVLISQDEN